MPSSKQLKSFLPENTAELLVNLGVEICSRILKTANRECEIEDEIRILELEARKVKLEKEIKGVRKRKKKNKIHTSKQDEYELDEEV